MGNFGHRTVWDEPFDAERIIRGLDGTQIELPTTERDNVDTDALAYPDGAPGSEADFVPAESRRWGIGVVTVETADRLDRIAAARDRINRAIDSQPPTFV